MMQSARAAARLKGQPLMALVAVPFAWAMLRFATMDAGQPGDLALASTFAQTRSVAAEPQLAFRTFAESVSLGQRWIAIELPAQEASPLAASPPTILPYGERHPPTTQLPKGAIERDSARFEQTRPADAFPASAVWLHSKSTQRWQIDAWLVLREGSEQVRSLATTLPLYGGSQAGAVVRYQLVPESSYRPAAYLRAVHALGGVRESDVAIGVSARPVGSLSLAGHAEMRATRRSDGIEFRPAAFLTAGIDDAPLPFGARVRGYAQMGYVGGREPTAFADGSLTADRQVSGRGDNTLSLGAGSWGGAQRGAGRLDIGPSASLRFPLGDGSGRLALDYRLRVAGNAEPASGAALTLSAGF